MSPPTPVDPASLAIAHGAITPTQDVDVAAPMTEGKSFRVLSLDQLIAVKAHLRRAKDEIVEAELRAIRDRLREVDR